MQEWIVLPREEGEKLVAFLSVKLGQGASAKQIKRWIEANRCCLNGRPERFASTLLHKGDKVSFDTGDIDAKRTVCVAFEKERVLYDDDKLILYNKPASINCDEEGIIKLLRQHCAAAILIHRLDRDTTGVLMFAKDKKTFDAMVDQFRSKKVEKTYLALVEGIPSSASGTIHDYLAKIGDRGGQAIWGSVAKGKGEEACTEWEVKMSGKKASLLVCRPITGRTHQIRVHLSEMGHPIIGDTRYCHEFKSGCRALRPLLHSFRVSFVHPATGKRIKAEAPLTADFIEVIERYI